MDSLAKLVAPIILVAVVIWQMVLAFGDNLTPWKGGGFGMFASTDSLPRRSLVCVGTTQSGERIQIDPMAHLDARKADSMRAFPSRFDLTAFAESMLQGVYAPRDFIDEAAIESLRKQNPDQAERILPNKERVYQKSKLPDFSQTGRASIKLSEVELQWWRVRYDHQKKQVWTEALSPMITLSRNDR